MAFACLLALSSHVGINKVALGAKLLQKSAMAFLVWSMAFVTVCLAYQAHNV